jgi:hypothetical protein
LGSVKKLSYRSGPYLIACTKPLLRPGPPFHSPTWSDFGPNQRSPLISIEWLCARIGRTKSTFARCFRNPRSFLSLPRRSALHRDTQRHFNGDEGNDAECWRHREPARRRMRPPEGGGDAAERLLGGARRQRRDVQRRRQAPSVNYGSGALLPVHEVRGPEDGVGGYYIRSKLPPYSC